MRSTFRLYLSSIALLLGLCVYPQSAFSYESLYAGRLFLVGSSCNDISRKGFNATCSGLEMCFEQTTLEETQQLGKETILFPYDVREIYESRQFKCFTEHGNFVNCKLVESMASANEDGWVACQITGFNDPTSF